MKDIKVTVGPTWNGVHGCSTIDHRIRRKLDLTVEEYCVCAFIYMMNQEKKAITIDTVKYHLGMEEEFVKNTHRLMDHGFLVPGIIRGMNGATSDHLITANKWDDEFITKEADFDKFIRFVKLYPGTKRSPLTEFTLFKKHKDWKEILPELYGTINKQIQIRIIRKASNEFVPEWKNLSTWINQRCWEEQMPIITTNAQPAIKGSFL